MSAYYSDMYKKPTCVYRLYDSEFGLLYVGLSKNTSGRFSKHAYQKPWWPEVEHIHLDWYEDRESAKDAERWAIFTEDPEHNLARPVIATKPTRRAFKVEAF